MPHELATLHPVEHRESCGQNGFVTRSECRLARDPVTQNFESRAPAVAPRWNRQTAIDRHFYSASGQMSLPARVRHRWDLDEGGPVDVIDLGFGVLTVPRGQGRRLLDDLVSRDEHADFVRTLEDDPDLATT